MEANAETSMQVDVIIPAYNERDRIGAVLTEVATYIHENDLPWRVVVSIDGDDGTDAIVRSFAEQYSFISFNRVTGRSGKGNAIKRALSTAAGDAVMLLDADNSIPFHQLLPGLRYLQDFDVVNFDRYKLRSNRIPFIRRFVSRGFNLYVRLILGIGVNDTQCGYKIMKLGCAKNLFSRISITNGFFYAPLFFYMKRSGYRTVELPVKYNHDTGSKFRVPNMIIGGFFTTFSFRLRNSPIYKFIPRSLVNLYYRKFRWI